VGKNVVRNGLFVILVIVFLSFSISEAYALQPELKIKYLLLTDDCSYDTIGIEFASLIEVIWYYMESWVHVPETWGFCVTPEQFVDFDLFEYEPNTIRVYMIDIKYWENDIYLFFGYDPPKDITNTGGEIFFDDRLILMSFSLADDFNAPVLTHELLHYALWKNDLPKVAYIDDVHRDWKIYKENYDKREKLYSYISKQYYFVFG